MKINRYTLILVYLLTRLALSPAQIGGTRTYAFLDLPNSARIASLGGKMIAVSDDDLNLPFHNPSLLNDQMHNHVVMNYVNYFADIYYAYASYARTYPGIGNLSVGIHYINYGSFTAANETGLITGNFKAAEYALNLMYSRNIDSSLTFGINLKPVYSSLENYQSFGLATDLGLTYHSRDQLFVASIVLRNLGFQFKSYYNSQQESLPFEIELGISQRLRHAPFRFIFTAQQLQRPDLTYQKPENQQKIDPSTGNPIGENRLTTLSDQILRHLVAGIEFIPLKSFYFRFGYNYQRRKELMFDAKPGFVGFSWGFGIRISKFQLSYGRASYHLAGASNHFSISANISEFLHKSTDNP